MPPKTKDCRVDSVTNLCIRCWHVSSQHPIETWFSLDEHFTSDRDLKFLDIVHQNSVDSILILFLSFCLIESCPVHPAIVPAMIRSVYRLGNMLEKKFNHIEKVVLTVVSGIHGYRPKAVLTNREQNLQFDVFNRSFYMSSVHAIETKGFGEVPILL